MKKLASWNVNGIRAINKKGFTDWLKDKSPDIVGLQEIKAEEPQIPQEILKHSDYYGIFYPAERPGYSGTALLLKKNIVARIWRGLGVEEYDREGRTIIAEFKDLWLFNCYYPNGGDENWRVPYKLRYSEAILQKALELKKISGKEIIIMGDINTAHQEIDLKNPESNRNTTGFLWHERVYIDKLLSSGFSDIFREFYPGKEGCYTWWSYRTNARARNAGWRIDAFFLSNGLKRKVKEVYHDDQTMGSDHCPIMLQF